MYNQLPPHLYPKSIFIASSLLFSEVERIVFSNHFAYPFAVKPDVGMMGFLFRKINNREEFKAYHQQMPVDYIVQELIHYPVEVSVFYYRFPKEQKGTITGFLKKEMLQVTGDGISTLDTLLHRLEARPGFKIKEWRLKHAGKLQDVIAADAVFKLSWVANLSRGGKLVSLAHEKDEKLLSVFDGLSHYAKHFYYGRYDIKCASVQELKEGKSFSILEYNGSGAEPHHIYGAGNTLLQAYKIVLQHWHVLYKISTYNHRQGISYWTFKEGWMFLKKAKKHFKLLKRLDAQLPVSD